MDIEMSKEDCKEQAESTKKEFLNDNSLEDKKSDLVTEISNNSSKDEVFYDAIDEKSSIEKSFVQEEYPQLEECVIETNNEIIQGKSTSDQTISNKLSKTDLDCENTTQTMPRGTPEDCKIVIEEVEDAQSSGSIDEETFQVVEEESSEKDLTNDDLEDLQSNKVDSGTTEDLLIEEISYSGSPGNSEVTEVENDCEMLGNLNKTGESVDGQRLCQPQPSSVEYPESVVPENLKLNETNVSKNNLDNEIKCLDSKENATPVSTIVEDGFDNKYRTTHSDKTEAVLITTSKSQEDFEPISNLSDGSMDKRGGSIEVSQQETIERSIDMLFETPCDDQNIQSSVLASVHANTSKEIKQEVSIEAKKLFSEEIQKEMLKLSPDHGTQTECSSINVPNSPSPSTIDTNKDNSLKSKENVALGNDDHDLSDDSTPIKGSRVDEVPAQCHGGEEAILDSHESDIETVREIDSFLKEDDSEINKQEQEQTPSVTKSSSKNFEVTDDEENLMQVECSSKNEKANAEDVMLSVEGDLDLDSSLTYDSKKLDLSPSSEPTISEENYDLLGDSYDNETLGKEQENINSVSQGNILDDIKENAKDCLLFINSSTSKENEPITQSISPDSKLSDNENKLQVCEVGVNQRLKEGKDFQSITRESSNEESCLPLNSDQESVSALNETQSENLKPNSTSSLIYGQEESKAKLSSADCVSLLQQEKYRNENPKSCLPDEESDIQKDSSKHLEVNLKSNVTEQVVSAASREPRDVELDFENFIPSSTISSLGEKGSIGDENSCIDVKCKEKTISPLGKVRYEGEEKSEEFETNVKPPYKLSEESMIAQTANSSNTPIDKTGVIEDSVESLVGSTDKSIDKTNNQPSVSKEKIIEENEGKDQITTDISREPKQFKLSKISTDSNIVNASMLPKESNILLQDSQPLKDNFDKTSNETKSVLDSSLSEQAQTTMIDVKSKVPVKNIDSISGLVDEEKTVAFERDQESEFSSQFQPDETTKSSKKQESCSPEENVDSHTSSEIFVHDENLATGRISDRPTVLANVESAEAMPLILDQASKPKIVASKEVPAPVRVSARQKQRQAAAAALAAKEKGEPEKSPGVAKKVQDKPGDKRAKKSLSPTKELFIKIGGKTVELGKHSPLSSQKSPKNLESPLHIQISPKKAIKEPTQDKLEPITLKLSKEDNPVIVRSSSLSPKKSLSPHSPQGKTLGYTMKIGKDSTTIIPKASTPSPTRREASPGTSTKADLSGKVGYLIKDTGLTITPVSPAETQEQKLNKITLKLSKAGGHPEIKQENKNETWKAIRKLGEIDIVPVEEKISSDALKRKEKSEEGSPEKKIKLGDVTVEPSTSSGVSKLQGLLTQAPLNQSESSEEGKFTAFGSQSEKVSPGKQHSYDIGMIRHDDSPQPPRKRGRPRKITSPDHSVSMQHSLPTGLTAKDILAASLQNQSLQQLHASYQSQQSFQSSEDMDSSQPMVPLFDLFEETYMDPTPPTVFPDQVQPSTEIIMRSARGRPIGRSRRPRGSSLLRAHERGGPRGRPRGSRGMKRIMEEMEAMKFPDPDQPITLENIDAEMGPRIPEHAASELTMALLRKSIEGKKEISEKKARKSDGSEEENTDMEARVREMKEKIEAAYQAELKSPNKEGKKRTPEKLGHASKSPPALIPLHPKQDESVSRKSTEGAEPVKRKLSEDRKEENQLHPAKRKSTEENPDSLDSTLDDSCRDDSLMEVDQSVSSIGDQEVKTEPEPPPKPVKPRPRSKAEIKRIKREKDRLRREAKKLAALEALKAPPPNPSEEDTRMSASDLNGDGLDESGIKKNRMEVGDPEGKEFTVEQIAEYQWPLQGGELYMIQEQISTWLGVKSFQRKYPDLKRRRVEMEERTYLCDSGLVSESMCDLGLTSVSSSEVLDVMFQDFPDQYEELRKHMREKQAREVILKQKERKKFEQTLSKSDLKEHAMQSLVSWNANLNRSRRETRQCSLDLQTWTVQYPRGTAAHMTRPSVKLGSYPVALIPGQYSDYYKRYTPQELRYFPVNTVLYGPLQPNEMHSTGGSDGSQSESEDSSSSDGTSDSSSDGEGTEEEERERECKTCGSKRSGMGMVQCSQCSHNNTTVSAWA